MRRAVDPPCPLLSHLRRSGRATMPGGQGVQAQAGETRRRRQESRSMNAAEVNEARPGEEACRTASRPSVVEKVEMARTAHGRPIMAAGPPRCWEPGAGHALTAAASTAPVRTRAPSAQSAALARRRPLSLPLRTSRPRDPSTSGLPHRCSIRVSNLVGPPSSRGCPRLRLCLLASVTPGPDPRLVSARCSSPPLLPDHQPRAASPPASAASPPRLPRIVPTSPFGTTVPARPQRRAPAMSYPPASSSSSSSSHHQPWAGHRTASTSSFAGFDPPQIRYAYASDANHCPDPHSSPSSLASPSSFGNFGVRRARSSGALPTLNSTGACDPSLHSRPAFPPSPVSPDYSPGLGRGPSSSAASAQYRPTPALAGWRGPAHEEPAKDAWVAEPSSYARQASFGQPPQTPPPSARFKRTTSAQPVLATPEMTPASSSSRRGSTYSSGQGSSWLGVPEAAPMTYSRTTATANQGFQHSSPEQISQVRLL